MPPQRPFKGQVDTLAAARGGVSNPNGLEEWAARGGSAAIRILIVDDHPIVREGLIAVLEDEPGFSIAGTAASAEDGLQLAATVRPDVVLLDLELPGIDGVTAIPRFEEARPGAAVVVLTAYDSDDHVFGALKAGAKGYLLKGVPADEIARAVRTVAAGGSALDQRVAARLVAGVRAPRRGGRLLTERERGVLRLVADGLPNKQIARALNITERTVKFHIASASRKLEADNRAQAAALAIRRGLL
jgi:DNA-binding NarL/FixJ family response regulator